eukprot:COSAG05_NODE_176_length_14928_cov_75.109717_2_plen_86_part_00
MSKTRFYPCRIAFSTQIDRAAAAAAANQPPVERVKTSFQVAVGRGTTLAMAEKYGFSSVGIDNDRDQCKKARELTVGQLESYLCK